MRKFETGPGFIRATNCHKCGHTRCGNDCTCDCKTWSVAQDLIVNQVSTYRTQVVNDKNEWIVDVSNLTKDEAVKVAAEHDACGLTVHIFNEQTGQERR